MFLSSRVNISRVNEDGVFVEDKTCDSMFDAYDYLVQQCLYRIEIRQKDLKRRMEGQPIKDYEEWIGKINDRYGIHMFLSFSSESGYYYYDSKGPDKVLHLEMKNLYIDQKCSCFDLLEYDENGNNTGSFSCFIREGAYLSGTFTTASGKEMTVKLTLNGGE